MAVPVLTHEQSRRRIAELREQGCEIAIVTYSNGDRRVYKKCPALLENQTPAPNLIGYAVLAGFGAALLYAIFRPKRAEAAMAPPPKPPEACALETAEDFARLESWATTKQIAVVYLPGTTTPPSPQLSELARTFVSSPAGVVVITSDGSFWTYDSGQPLPSSTFREDFCNYKPPPSTTSGLVWLS